MLNLRCVLRGLLCALAFVAGGAWAVTDVTLKFEHSYIGPPVDRWVADYSLSGSFSAFEGIDLNFDRTLFSDLVLDVEPDADAFLTPALLVNPDPGLGADGFLSLLTLREIDPSEVFKFTVSFVRLGASPLGSQPFSTFDENFSPVGGGITIPIPEPATGSLLLAGIAGLVVLGRWRLSRGVSR